MAISYFPLEPDFQPPPPQVSPPQVSPPSQSVFTSNFFEGETTECNYLVLAFVAGVMMLALTDSMRK